MESLIRERLFADATEPEAVACRERVRDAVLAAVRSSFREEDHFTVSVGVTDRLVRVTIERQAFRGDVELYTGPKPVPNGEASTIMAAIRLSAGAELDDGIYSTTRRTERMEAILQRIGTISGAVSLLIVSAMIRGDSNLIIYLRLFFFVGSIPIAFIVTRIAVSLAGSWWIKNRYDQREYDENLLEIQDTWATFRADLTRAIATDLPG